MADERSLGNPAESMTQEEKMLPQSVVNEIAGKSRIAGYEQGKKEAAMELQKQAYHAAGANLQSTSSPSSSSLTPEQVAKQIRDAIAEKHQQEEEMRYRSEAERIAGDFHQKLSRGVNKYPDFEEKIGVINFKAPSVAPLAHMASLLPNTEDVMYDLAKNRNKLNQILSLIREDQGEAAFADLQELSQSIDVNAKATAKQLPPDPLSQISSSTTATDNGEMSVTDFSKMFRNKRR